MKLETEQDATQWMWAAKALAVVTGWNALGVFERLRNGPLPRTELGIEARALTTTLPVVLQVGLVATDGDRVALTANGERMLAAGTLPTEQNLEMLRDLGRIKDVLERGGPARDDAGKPKVTRGGTRPEDVARTERFLDMLYRLAEAGARSTFAWLAPGLRAGSAVLDLGGGHGRYARTFADAGHRVTLFDQPFVVDIAKRRHGDRLTYLAGDFHEVDGFGGPYDLVLVCNVLHSERADQNATMIAKAARSLAPGGRVAVLDMFVDEHGHEPSAAVYFGVTMLFYTEHGASPSVRQTQEWLARAGLVDFRFTSGGGHQIAVASKP